MLTQDRFLKLLGNRKITDLNSPVINKLDDFRLPRGSVYYFISQEPSDIGIPTSHWSLKEYEKVLMVSHVTELPENLKVGNPRKNNESIDILTKGYHRRFRKARPARNLQKAVKDVKTHLAINLAPLLHAYKYTKSAYSTYHKRMNVIQAFCASLTGVGAEVEREHFFSLELPDSLPSLTQLKQVEKEIPLKLMEQFTDVNMLLLLEIWKWLGDNREDSYFHDVPIETLRNTNIVVKKLNNWFVLNLGLLDDWRDGLINEGNIKPELLQKRFLRMAIMLIETSSPTVTRDISINEVDIEADESSDELLEDTKPIPTRSEIKEVIKKGPSDEQLEQELDSLEQIRAAQEIEQKKDLFQEEAPTLDTALETKLEEMAQNGTLTVREYNKLKEQTKSHEAIKDPYTGKGSITALTEIMPEEINISAPEQFKDKDTVVDKSMLQSTIGTFDQQYVSKVLKKDIVNAVMSLPKAGVSVTEYEVEEVEDVANAYEIHTVRVQPLGGKKSTLTFKVPKVTEEGTYLSNNIKYKMRKQRGDLPIRKTNPTTVALTSYYGKVFMRRSPKVVNDHQKWLSKQLKLINLDKEDNRVTKLVGNSKFNFELDVPKVYSELGQDFESFKSGGIQFFFGHDKRKDYFGVDKLSSVEKNGTVLVGKKGDNFVVVDDNDVFYQVVNGKLEELGVIEDIVKLDKSKAPTEIIDIKIQGANIPLGFLLSYYIGLERLLTTLKAKYRKVPSGERVTASEDEMVLKFEDYNLIIDKDDRLVTMIVGGFKEYTKSISRYQLDSFNSKDIYLNVLTDFGMNIRIIREFDLLKDMFVDPITLEILTELKQPTTWLGILKYAANLLLKDKSFKETDLREMRIKGYERISGAIYSELVSSIRGYHARGGLGNAGIELHPFAVWKAIDSDPSVTISEESNPIKNINEKEAVTFMGVGGRSRDSMVGRTRVFDDSDMGTISEATVDSGDVAINTYTVANPKLTSVRGLTDRFKPSEDGATSMVSTAALLSPSADRED